MLYKAVDFFTWLRKVVEVLHTNAKTTTLWIPGSCTESFQNCYTHVVTVSRPKWEHHLTRNYSLWSFRRWRGSESVAVPAAAAAQPAVAAAVSASASALIPQQAEAAAWRRLASSANARLRRWQWILTGPSALSAHVLMQQLRSCR